MGSKFSEVIIEIEANRLGEEITVHATAVEVLILVRNAILTQGLTHVQVDTAVFPGVASCMGVVVEVAL